MGGYLDDAGMHHYMDELYLRSVVEQGQRLLLLHKIGFMVANFI